MKLMSYSKIDKAQMEAFMKELKKMEDKLKQVSSGLSSILTTKSKKDFSIAREIMTGDSTKLLIKQIKELRKSMHKAGQYAPLMEAMLINSLKGMEKRAA
jgi:hypothetical protein